MKRSRIIWSRTAVVALIGATTYLVGMACAEAQGTINFNNRNISYGIDAPIFYAEQNLWGRPVGARIDGTQYPTAFAALYGGPDGATEAELQLVGAVVNFRSGIAAGYVNVGSQTTRELNNVSGGAFAIVQVRAWDANNSAVQSFEEALVVPGALVGKSATLRLRTGNPSPTPDPPTPLYGLQSFGLYVVPEPSAVALIALGSIGLCAIRRKTRPVKS